MVNSFSELAQPAPMRAAAFPRYNNPVSVARASDTSDATFAHDAPPDFSSDLTFSSNIDPTLQDHPAGGKGALVYARTASNHPFAPAPQYWLEDQPRSQPSRYPEPCSLPEGPPYYYRRFSQELSAIPGHGNGLFSQRSSWTGERRIRIPSIPKALDAASIAQLKQLLAGKGLELVSRDSGRPVFALEGGGQRERFVAEKPTKDAERHWVRINSGTKGTSRTGKINKYNPKTVYQQVSHPLGSWRSSNFDFKYSVHGELADPTYSAKQLQQFIYEHPTSHGCDLTIWIQRTPADSARRYPSQQSSKCRFRRCPVQLYQNGSIRAGHYRVAFDERWTTFHDQTDPFYVAGYAHLYCMERFLDFEDICKRFPVRIDDRRLFNEPKQHFAASLDRLQEASVAAKFIKLCKFDTLRADPAWQDYPVHEVGNNGPKPHQKTLTYAMMAEKESTRPPAQARALERRGCTNSMAHVHLGDLEMAVGSAISSRRPRADSSEDEGVWNNYDLPRPSLLAETAHSSNDLSAFANDGNVESITSTYPVDIDIQPLGLPSELLANNLFGELDSVQAQPNRLCGRLRSLVRKDYREAASPKADGMDSPSNPKKRGLASDSAEEPSPPLAKRSRVSLTPSSRNQSTTLTRRVTFGAGGSRPTTSSSNFGSGLLDLPSMFLADDLAANFDGFFTPLNSLSRRNTIVSRRSSRARSRPGTAISGKPVGESTGSNASGRHRLSTSQGSPGILRRSSRISSLSSALGHLV